MLVGVPTFAQVEFDNNDVESLRQLQLQLSQGKPMTVKQLRQFERINTHVSNTSKLPIAALDSDVLIAYAERLYYNYQENKRSESNAKKFIFILKRLYRTDPLILNKMSNIFLSEEQKTALINEIK